MTHTCFWNNEILTPIQKHGMQEPGKVAFKKLRVLLDRIMLRRTKIQRADDLGLPPRTVIVRRDYFSPEEKELYLSLFSDAKREFSTYVDAGTLLNSELCALYGVAPAHTGTTTDYSNIFSLITRMRQMACHPDLVIRSKKNASMFGKGEGEATVCRLCNDVAEDAIQSKCRHIFDRECIKQYLDASIEAQVILTFYVSLRRHANCYPRSLLAPFVTSPSQLISRHRPWSWKFPPLRVRASLAVWILTHGDRVQR